MSNQVKICKYCHAQNPLDKIKCWQCERPLYGSMYATETSPVDTKKHQPQKKKRGYSR